MTKILFWLAILAAFCGTEALAADRPNILFLFADDQRNNTLGCAGHPIIKTPNIDRLAAEGTRFENMFVTTSVCWVSRAVVLTGQWARSQSFPDRMPDVRPDAMAGIYPLRLREAGYRTGFFGKWHIHAPAGTQPKDLYTVAEVIGRNPYLKPQPDGTTRHEAQLIADRAISFLAAQDKSKPFCLNLWFNTAHAEDGDKRLGFHYQWPATVDGMYEDVSIPPPRLSDPAIFESQPDFLKKSINRDRFFWGYDTPEKFQTNMRAYFRMITGLDGEIGRVLAALKEQGLANNTIIVYSADNGYYMGDRGFQGKWSHYEESLRVPLIVYDPRVPKEKRGRVVPQMALNVDLPATVLDWAGIAKPATYQGRSLAPLVRGEAAPDWRREFFCEHLDLSPTLVWEGVRGERYVYARYVHQSPALEFLHDLKSDPDERKNLATDPANAAQLAALRKHCDEVRAGYGPPIPPANAQGTRKRKAKE